MALVGALAAAGAVSLACFAVVAGATVSVAVGANGSATTGSGLASVTGSAVLVASWAISGVEVKARTAAIAVVAKRESILR